MNILFIILFSANIIMCLVSFIGFEDYNSIFQKTGFTVSKKTFSVNNNRLVNNVGNKISKEDTAIKIISGNTLYFYSYKRSQTIEWLLTYRLVPDIIFGDCNIINNNAVIQYKVSVFFISLIFTCVIFIMYDCISSFTVTPISIFIAGFLGLAIFLQYFKLKSIQTDVEFFLSTGK